MIDRKKAADRSLKNGMEGVTGVDVLAVTAANINDYACGSWALIMRDVDQLLASHSAEVLAVLESAQVPHAFRLRRELVSMKKCAFFLHEQGCAIERQLTQLATFFHNEHQQEPDRPGWRHSDRLTELSDARMQCAGACKATFDGRAIAKLICSLPRHPEKKRPETLDTLPNSLHSFRVAAAAAAAAEYGLLTPAPSRLKRLRPVTCAGAGCGGVSQFRHRSTTATVASAIAAQEWPPAVKETVDAILLCRGADKALRMVDEVSRAKAAFGEAMRLGGGALDKLRALPTVQQTAESLGWAGCASGEAVAAAPAAEAVTGVVDAVATKAGEDELTPPRLLAAAMHRHRHVNLLTGCLPVLREMHRWLESAEEAAAAGTSHFIAGDARDNALRGSQPVMYGPIGSGPTSEDGQNLFLRFKQVEERFRPELRIEVALRGWPEHIASRRGIRREHVSDNKHCTQCSEQFSALWVHRGTRENHPHPTPLTCPSPYHPPTLPLPSPYPAPTPPLTPPPHTQGVCCECEASLREQGRCPFSVRCRSAWFCPHAKRCIVCDAHSCERCRLQRGGPELVATLAKELRPARILLDFDRTLASTRSGGLPIFGKHSCDEELLTLLWEHRSCCAIVTRNSHRAAIGDFLRAHGAPPEIPVHVVQKGCSKAEFICEGVAEGELALFVDDSILEHVDPRIAGDESVCRVLFVRGLL